MKRDRDSDQVDPADRPSKRKCLTFFDDDDMLRLKDEIAGIKKSIRNVDILLDDLLLVYDNQQLS